MSIPRQESAHEQQAQNRRTFRVVKQSSRRFQPPLPDPRHPLNAPHRRKKLALLTAGAIPVIGVSAAQI
jgi:hypothetical protein